MINVLYSDNPPPPLLFCPICLLHKNLHSNKIKSKYYDCAIKKTYYHKRVILNPVINNIFVICYSYCTINDKLYSNKRIKQSQQRYRCRQRRTMTDTYEFYRSQQRRAISTHFACLQSNTIVQPVAVKRPVEIGSATYVMSVSFGTILFYELFQLETNE